MRELECRADSWCGMTMCEVAGLQSCLSLTMAAAWLVSSISAKGEGGSGWVQRGA